MRGFIPVTVVMAVLLVPAAEVSGALEAQPSVWNIVALGDSDASGEGDSTGLGWVGRYARLLRQELGLKVVVTNLAENGKTSSELRSLVRSDTVRARSAEEGADRPRRHRRSRPRSRRERLGAGTCQADACYAADLQAFGRNLAATAAVVRKLRSSKKAVLRAITLPNPIPGGADVVPPFITQEIGVYQSDTPEAADLQRDDEASGPLRRRLPGVQRAHGNRERVREGLAGPRIRAATRAERTTTHGPARFRDGACATSLSGTLIGAVKPKPLDPAE